MSIFVQRKSQEGGLPFHFNVGSAFPTLSGIGHSSTAQNESSCCTGFFDHVHPQLVEAQVCAICMSYTQCSQ